MQDLIIVKNEQVFVDSHVVSKKMDRKHSEVVKTIREVLGTLEDISEDVKGDYIFEEEQRNYRGTDFTAYLMNREAFSLVAMRMTSKQARIWQVKFNSAFYEMEKVLLQYQTNKSDIEWTQTRAIGKQARLEETDVIKRFVDYATAQGSKSARFYYKHITNATYKALGLISQKEPKIRDMMNIYEISQLMLAEKLAANRIKKYMDLGRNYKDIYDTVKNDLIDYAKAISLN